MTRQPVIPRERQTVSIAELARACGVHWRTAWRWVERAKRGGMRVQHEGRRIRVNIKNIRPWIPALKHRLVRDDEYHRWQAELSDMAQRLDVMSRSVMDAQALLLNVESRVRRLETKKENV